MVLNIFPGAQPGIGSLGEVEVAVTKSTLTEFRVDKGDVALLVSEMV